MFEEWLPTIVSSGALGLVFWGIRAQRAEMTKKVEKIEDDYLQKDDHDKLDEIQYLKLEKIISIEINKLKDVLFPEFRKIKDLLPNAKNKE